METAKVDYFFHLILFVLRRPFLEKVLFGLHFKMEVFVIQEFTLVHKELALNSMILLLKFFNETFILGELGLKKETWFIIFKIYILKSSIYILETKNR